MVFEAITKYSKTFVEGEAGDWIVDATSKGTTDDPIHMPYLDYSADVLEFVQAFNQAFVDYDYLENLMLCGIETGMLDELDLHSLDVVGILALITKFVRGDRFCEGLLKSAIEHGVITELLSRLKEIDEAPAKATLEDAVYGLAVGDAMGVPGEFQQRGSYRIDSMVGGGLHNQPRGTWSDDTSMTLATCSSIKKRGKVDLSDIRKQFCAWLYEGNTLLMARFSTVETLLQKP